MATDIFEDFDEESQKLLERLGDKMLCFGNSEFGRIDEEIKVEDLFEGRKNNLKNRKPCQ